jgi:RNA-splicing ligase RtcB
MNGPKSRLKGEHEVLLWTDVHDVESSALDQLKNTANLPYIYPHIAVMPDVHYGIGATVGSVVPMLGAVAPAAVGVDIGCGMAAVQTNLTANDLPDDLGPLRSDVEATIPVAHNGHAQWTDYATGLDLFKEWNDLHPKAQSLRDKATSQMGTLGGGNHFIELCLDEDDRVWLFLHSGSRNIGKTLAEIHIEVARSMPHNADLPDRDLAVFLTGTPEMDAYRRDLFWAQRYAGGDAAGVRARAAGLEAVRRVRDARELPPQLRLGGESLREGRARHAQGSDLGTRGRVRTHPRLDGDAVVRRARQGQSRVAALGIARCRTTDVAWSGQAHVHG